MHSFIHSFAGGSFIDVEARLRCIVDYFMHSLRGGENGPAAAVGASEPPTAGSVDTNRAQRGGPPEFEMQIETAARARSGETRPETNSHPRSAGR